MPATLQAVTPTQTRVPRPEHAHGTHVAVKSLSHSYQRSQDPVLEDIDLEIAQGQIVALLGRSGCGKSTLLHMLAGLLHPSEGAIYLDGNRVTEPSPRWVLMFQAPSLLPWLTVEQNAALGLRFTRRSREISTRVPEVLDLVEMQGFADRNVQDLSGGQQQRVALARSLAPRPEMLLLDEPFSALDAFTRDNLQHHVRSIARNLGLTLVLVSHDVTEAVRMADRVILLQSDPGRVAGDVEIDLGEDARAHGGERFSEEVKLMMDRYGRIASGAPAPAYS